MSSAAAPGMTGTVLVVANAADPDSGYVGERFAELGYELRTVLRESGDLPAVAPPGVGVLLLLGSDWSVHSPSDAAALAAECALVRAAGVAGVPVLGLCYGAQVIAQAYDGRVRQAAEPEVGPVAVETIDPDLVPAGPWQQFHLDVIDPPPGADVVARNDCGVQAFTLPGVVAVQFHPEVRPEVLDDWASRFPGLLAQVGVEREDLVAQARVAEPDARARAHALVDAFLARTRAASA